MAQSQVITIMTDAIYTILLCSAPMLIAGLGVGVIVSIFQATTQINEQTLAFVPKIVAIFLAMIFFWGFISNNLNDFGNRVFEYMGSMGP